MKKEFIEKLQKHIDNVKKEIDDPKTLVTQRWITYQKGKTLKISLDEINDILKMYNSQKIISE